MKHDDKIEISQEETANILSFIRSVMSRIFNLPTSNGSATIKMVLMMKRQFRLPLLTADLSCMSFFQYKEGLLEQSEMWSRRALEVEKENTEDGYITFFMIYEQSNLCKILLSQHKIDELIKELDILESYLVCVDSKDFEEHELLKKAAKSHVELSECVYDILASNKQKVH